jgi:hypothetical protein
MDEFPHFAVVLVDENNARLFTVGLGEIQEYRRPRVGIVDAIRRMMRSEHLSQVILAGPPETTTELRSVIEKRLRSALIATTNIAFNTEPAEILRRTMPLGEQLQAKGESEIVRDLTVQPPEGSWTVTGLGATLDLLNQGRLWQLVYAEGLRGSAHECRQCAAIFGESHQHCEYCGSPLQAVGNLADLIYKHSTRRGTQVRKVGADAAAALSAAGSIGGFVKTEQVGADQRRQGRR